MNNPTNPNSIKIKTLPEPFDEVYFDWLREVGLEPPLDKGD